MANSKDDERVAESSDDGEQTRTNDIKDADGYKAYMNGELFSELGDRGVLFAPYMQSV